MGNFLSTVVDLYRQGLEVRKIEAEARIAEFKAREAEAALKLLELQSIQRLSVGKKDAVFILCVFQGGVYVNSGTAFAITSKLLLTCFHSLHVEEEGEGEGDFACDAYKCALASSARMNEEEIVDLNFTEYAVKVVAFNRGEDWAVLKLIGDEKFPIFIPLCDRTTLPRASSSTVLSEYYFPLSLLDNGMLSEVLVWSQNVSLMQVRDEKAVVSGGKTRGSSGCPVVTSDGKAFAMHLSSINERQAAGNRRANKEIKCKSKQKNEARITELETTMSELSESVADVSHADFSECLVLCCVPRLLDAIRTHDASDT